MIAGAGWLFFGDEFCRFWWNVYPVRFLYDVATDGSFGGASEELARLARGMGIIVSAGEKEGFLFCELSTASADIIKLGRPGYWPP